MLCDALDSLMKRFNAHSFDLTKHDWADRFSLRPFDTRHRILVPGKMVETCGESHREGAQWVDCFQSSQSTTTHCYLNQLFDRYRTFLILKMDS